jgi:hypothetical protein
VIGQFGGAREAHDDGPWDHHRPRRGERDSEEPDARENPGGEGERPLADCRANEQQEGHAGQEHDAEHVHQPSRVGDGDGGACSDEIRSEEGGEDGDGGAQPHRRDQPVSLHAPTDPGGGE